MNKVINKWITQFEGQTFNDHKQVIQYFKKTIPALVESIYKEELKIADDRWKRAEREEYKHSVSAWKRIGIERGYDKYFKIKW